MQPNIHNLKFHREPSVKSRNIRQKKPSKKSSFDYFALRTPIDLVQVPLECPRSKLCDEPNSANFCATKLGENFKTSTISSHDPHRTVTSQACSDTNC